MKHLPLKIVMVSANHAADDVRIVAKEARTLRGAGHTVHLLMGRPRSDVAPDYPLTVVRRPFDRALGRGAVSTLFAIPFIFIQALRLGGDVYHVHNPLNLPLLFLLRLFGRRVVYDTHEDFSRRLEIRTGIPKPLRRLLGKVVTLVERFAGLVGAAVIVTQHRQRDRFGANALLLENPPLKAYRLAPRHHDERSDGAPLTLVYAGGLSAVRCAGFMVDMLEELNRGDGAVRLKLLAPDGPDKMIERLSRSPGWRYVDYLGWLPHRQAVAEMTSADIGLAVIHKQADIPDAAINKLYEYMYAGIPFVASDCARWMAVAHNAQAGIFVDPENQPAVIGAIRRLAEDSALRARLGQTGRRIVMDEYNWERLSVPLTDFFATLASPARSDDCAPSRVRTAAERIIP